MIAQLPLPEDPGVLAALVEAVGTITAALIVGGAGGLITYKYNKARDRQDRESQWRAHAIELTKLDLERKLRWQDQAIELLKSEQNPKLKYENLEFRLQRQCVLDFLANYRDLVELSDDPPRGTFTPKDLYIEIDAKRTSRSGQRVRYSSQFALASRIQVILQTILRQRKT